jgi:hypothetical protein
MDTVVQVEILFNCINTLFAKSVAFSDEKNRTILRSLRKELYGGDCNYASTIQKLKEVQEDLQKYEY